ncbi:MAG: hypothetical protein ACK4UO_17800 [Pseudolabrys sp.]
MRKLVWAVAALAFVAASAQAGAATDLSAKKKRVVRGEQKIACTAFGCHPIPRGCYPTMGYTWDGAPSGFDVIVCPRRR